MELPIIVLAYAATAAVALVTVAGFSQAIDRVLFKLIAEEMASAWSLFIKFALFCVTFVGGMPPSNQGKFVGFTTPMVVPPVPGDGTMFVMTSIGGALMAASWYLLVFFGVTLTAHAAGRFYATVRERREKDAKEAEERKEKREKEEARHREEAAKNGAPQPPRRQEPQAARPVAKEDPARPVKKEESEPRAAAAKSEKPRAPL